LPEVGVSLRQAANDSFLLASSATRMSQSGRLLPQVMLQSSHADEIAANFQL
jgi:hypothetical protein